MLLELPQDVGAEELSELDFDYEPPQTVRSAGDPEAIRRAAQALLAAKDPIIDAGQGVMYAGAFLAKDDGPDTGDSRRLDKRVRGNAGDEVDSLHLQYVGDRRVAVHNTLLFLELSTAARGLAEMLGTLNIGP